jgi:long-chain acyl-CoA synthetase
MTASSINDFKFGTVGKPIPGMEVKIAEDGEIMNRGSNNMLGYYKDEEATRDTIDEDGWLHTGDIGEFDGDRFLRITDRKKNIIVTSGGKNVAPSPLENSLITSKYVEQSLAIGDERNFISALIVPAFEVLKGYAVKEGIKFDDSEDLVKDERILSLYDGIVNKAMKNFSRYESIRKFELLSNEWTIKSGELTPTLKIKRRIIEEKYVDLIDKMYNSTIIKSEGANEKNI